MTESLKAALANPQQAKAWLDSAYDRIKPFLMAGHRFSVTIKPEKRSDAQNRRLWAMLRDISQQVVWHGQKLTDEEWKHIFSASIKKQKVVPGIDGSFVVMGQMTRNMTKAEMSEMQELMSAFGAEREVQWSAPDEMQNM